MRVPCIPKLGLAYMFSPSMYKTVRSPGRELKSIITVNNHDNENWIWEHLVRASNDRTSCPRHAVSFLTATLAGRYYYPAHFTGEETEAHDLSNPEAAKGNADLRLSFPRD